MAETKRPLGFLDVDGVLVTRRSLKAVASKDICGSNPLLLDPPCVAALEEIQQLCNPEWVLSSTWRHTVSPEQMTDWLQERGFTGEITAACARWVEPRGALIADWLAKNPAAAGRPFFLLDDDRDTEPFWPHQVKTTMDEGLTSYGVRTVERILRRQGWLG